MTILARYRDLCADEIAVRRPLTFFKVLSRQFGHGDAASALSELQNFGVLNNTPYAAYYRAFRMVASGVTGSERALASGVGLELEIVRLSVYE